MPNTYVTNLYPKPTKDANDQTLSVANSVVQFGTAFDSLTRYIVLDVQDNDVRVTYDDSSPTVTNGHILFAGRSYTWSKEAAQAAKFINNTAAATGIIHASEFTD